MVYYSLRRITQYEELILEIQQVIKFSTDKMKLVDSKGHYESDDVNDEAMSKYEVEIKIAWAKEL